MSLEALMRRMLATAFVTAVLLVTTVPVSTITNGQPDNNRHPYVGLAIQFIPSMPGFVFLCSGSALSSTVFLTAAHCFDETLPVFVAFDSAPPFTIAQGAFHRHPDWCLGCGSGVPGFDTHDVAVITFETPLNIVAPFALLPAVGSVETLPMKTNIDVVGYGVKGFEHGGGKPTQVIDFTRRSAVSQLIQSNGRLSAEFLKLTLNPAQGKGGPCFGDSGGPNLLGGSDVVLGVTNFGINDNCTGVGYSSRIDLPDILKFINGFMNQ